VPPTSPVPAPTSPVPAPTDAARQTRLVAAVVPAPARATAQPQAAFRLSAEVTVRVSPDPAAGAVADYFAALLRRATGFALPVVMDGEPTVGDEIALIVDRMAGTDREGYRLDVTTDRIAVTASTAAGLFYGVQTLRQLLPPSIECATAQPGPWDVPAVRIEDAPRFAYRGAMLDVARHFFPVDDVLRVVDHLARYKLNHLHLHLTDDQGWRLAVDSWPRLAPVGGATQVGGGPGGYYGRDDYARIVEYAAAHHITVVPEIDLPGHTNAALAAYGALARDAAAPEPYTGTDVGFSAVDTSSELTYAFIDDVLTELAALTPGPYLHVGGDEAFTVPAADYAAFVDRLQRLVARTGKTVVGWHQFAVAPHAPGRVLQYWGTTPVAPVVADAVRRGARVILSPGDRAYLDMKYAADTPLGQNWAGFVDIRSAYDWDPGTYLVDVPEQAVLGVEAPLWTETIATLDEVEFMLFPRLPAIAELGWSPGSTLDWTGFRLRLAAQAPRWTKAGITFHRSPEVPWPTPAAAPASPAVPWPRPPVSAELLATANPDGDDQVGHQPPESSSSAPTGTSSASRSWSQPSGR
jgi:hexosaminidase